MVLDAQLADTVRRRKRPRDVRSLIKGTPEDRESTSPWRR